MALTIPVVILAGQSNAEITPLDDLIVSRLALLGNAFEFAKVAVSGTTIYQNSAARDWSVNTSGELFDALVEAARTTLAKVRADGNMAQVYLVWSQGEADIASTQARYSQALGSLIATFRERIGVPDAKVLISEMPDDNPVRAAQQQVAASMADVVLVETRGLERSDGVHFTAAAAAMIAERLFAATAIAVPASAGYQGLWNHADVAAAGAAVTVSGPGYYDYEFHWDSGAVPATSRFLVTSGWGADRLFTGDMDDAVSSGAGADWIVTRAGNDRIDAGDGRDVVNAGAGDDVVFGGEDPDTVWGGPGNDTIDLGLSSDIGYGDAGDDVLIGGWGPDTLTGGAGADTFVYLTATDSFEPGFAGIYYGTDTISDFEVGGDHIDLRAIGPLRFIAGAAFSGKGAAELRTEAVAGATLVRADLDGDGKGDFLITLSGAPALDASSFLYVPRTGPPVIPVMILAGQSNAEQSAIDDAIIAAMLPAGRGFEFTKVAQTEASLVRNTGNDWNPASRGEMFDRLVEATRTTMANVIAQGGVPEIHLLWVQGETDTYLSKASYAALLGDFITAFRAATGVPDAQVIISLLPDQNGARAAQMQVAGTLDHVATIDTTGLARNGLVFTAEASASIARAFVAATATRPADMPGYHPLIDATSVFTVNDHVEVKAAPFSDFEFRATLALDHRVTGSAAMDRITTEAGNDAIATGDGSDMVWSGGGRDVIDTGNGRDTVLAGAGDDIVRTGDEMDTAWGGDGNDLLDLGAWADTGNGDAGDDVLIGGAGGDRLTGGAGADTFVFREVRDSFDPGFRSPTMGIDTITDFVSGTDRIDLGALGHPVFIATDAFHARGVAELRYQPGTDQTLVQADLNGDGMTDLLIALNGRIALASGDFIV